MSATSRHLAPPVFARGTSLPVQLRLLLEHARGQLTPFDLAWEDSFRALRWPASDREASEWRKMLEATREGWRAAYDGWAPEPRELAVGVLFEHLPDLTDAAAA